jgi:acyl phosphate:glycerol-3-phosphate acyltransferase
MNSTPSVVAYGTGAHALWWLAALVVGSFAIGSIPFGIVIGRVFFRTDIRQAGSGNIGAANALRTLGRAGAFAVLLLDALKGFVPAFFGPMLILGPETSPFAQGPWAVLGAVAGFCALLGHCYSPWLRFRGGKGVATHLGVTFALAWPVGLGFIAVWLAAGLGSGYSSVGSLAATLASAVALWVIVGPAGLTYGVAAGLVVFARHRENLARLRAGTENPIRGLKKRNSE